MNQFQGLWSSKACWEKMARRDWSSLGTRLGCTTFGPKIGFQQPRGQRKLVPPVITLSMHSSGLGVGCELGVACRLSVGISRGLGWVWGRWFGDLIWDSGITLVCTAIQLAASLVRMSSKVLRILSYFNLGSSVSMLSSSSSDSLSIPSSSFSDSSCYVIGWLR